MIYETHLSSVSNLLELQMLLLTNTSVTITNTILCGLPMRTNVIQ